MQEVAIPLIEAARSLDPSSLAPLALDAVLGAPLRLALWTAAAAIALLLLELAVRAPAATARSGAPLPKATLTAAPATEHARPRTRSARQAAGDLPPAA